MSFLCFTLLFIQTLSSNASISLTSQDNLYLQIMSSEGNGKDNDLINWLRIPEIKNNVNIETALISSAPGYCLAILDTGLDQATWDELETEYGINFRLLNMQDLKLTLKSHMVKI